MTPTKIRNHLIFLLKYWYARYTVPIITTVAARNIRPFLSSLMSDILKPLAFEVFFRAVESSVGTASDTSSDTAEGWVAVSASSGIGASRPEAGSCWVGEGILLAEGRLSDEPDQNHGPGYLFEP